MAARPSSTGAELRAEVGEGLGEQGERKQREREEQA
jgi:hypothetical protein